MVNRISLILILIGSLLTAIAALFVKKGIDKFNFKTILRNRILLSGILLYGASSITYIIALKGDELSVLFPLASTTYIWSSFLSVKYLNEKMNFGKWCGVIGIIVGALFIGIGS